MVPPRLQRQHAIRHHHLKLPSYFVTAPLKYDFQGGEVEMPAMPST